MFMLEFIKEIALEAGRISVNGFEEHGGEYCWGH